MAQDDGIRALNQDFRRYEGVAKRQSYHLAETPDEDQFDDDFVVRTCDMRSPTFAQDHGDDPALYDEAERRIDDIFTRLSLEEKMRFRAQRHGSVNQGYFPIKETSNMHPALVEGWVFCRRAFERPAEFWPSVDDARFFAQITQAHEQLILPIMQSLLKSLGGGARLSSRKRAGTILALPLPYCPPMSDEDDASGAARLLGH